MSKLHASTVYFVAATIIVIGTIFVVYSVTRSGEPEPSAPNEVIQPEEEVSP